ncbi:sulfur carrier protein ThiS [Cellulomonas bogoriensis]
MPTPPPTAVINGERCPLGPDRRVSALVLDLLPDALGDDGLPSGVAVAVNDAVVPRGAWEQTLVHPDDRVEVLTAVQGG